MSRLPIPPENDKLEEIFTSCISTFRKNKRIKLEKCLSRVLADAVQYQDLIPEKIHQFKESALPEGVSADDMTKVYKAKFVRSKTYYEAIKSHAKRCPICGVRDASTLDHYLPESRMPTLVVTPINLIPACMECNHAKRDYMSLDPAETPVHMYLDEIDDEPWLYTEIGENLEVTFEVRCPQTWGSAKCSRVTRHLDFYKLHVLYSGRADSLIIGNKDPWRWMLQECGEVIFKEYISRCKMSAEKQGMNSWEAALYRGLEAHFQTLVACLHRENGDIPISA